MCVVAAKNESESTIPIIQFRFLLKIIFCAIYYSIRFNFEFSNIKDYSEIVPACTTVNSCTVNHFFYTTKRWCVCPPISSGFTSSVISGISTCCKSYLHVF